jgi:eukaryotic-like serine/threonine-protein kinase
MATVYLAEDLKHHRKVALKVLRPELAAVIGAARFLHEIQTTANLQHPHILPLHDSGEADGLVYYVMPYVEGESLRERLTREHQLPVEDAVRIAREVADALDYAHRHGVVHRDIKPENILLHDGRVQVADFGIALAVSTAGGGTRMTETGMSLGTPHYMAPEQAMGEREITPRADVYALGCVLYEMLVGEPPFTGPTAQAIVARVVTEEPRSLTLQRHTITPELEAVVRRALEKLPADRFGTAAQFAEALAHPESVPRAASRRGPVDQSPAGVLARFVLPITIVAVAAIALAVWALTRPAPPRLVNRYALFLAETQAPQAGMQFQIAPDGSRLVYARGGPDGIQLWVKERHRHDATPLAGTLGSGHFTVSPDGRWIAFLQTNQVKKISVMGGAATTLADSASMAVPGLAWLDDGSLLFSRTGEAREIRRVPDVGGPAVTVWRSDSLSALLLTPLPGSRGALFTGCQNARCGANHDLWVLDLPSGEARMLLPGVATARYLTTGHVAYVRQDGAMFIVPFDLGRLSLAGQPVPVLDSVAVVGPIFAQFAVSNAGTLIVRQGSSLSSAVGHHMVWVDRSGRETVVDSGWTFRHMERGANAGWSLSPDGTRLAIGLNTEAGDNIWVKHLPTGPLQRISFDSAADYRPRWSPDGRAVIYGSFRDTPSNGLYRRNADGTGRDELMVDLPQPIFEGVWSRDGQWILVRTGGTLGLTGGRDIWAIRPGVDSAPRPVVITPDFDEAAIALSPDGRWLAYESNETGRTEVFLRPFPDVEAGKWQISISGGVAPLWAPGGRELFYVNTNREMVAVSIASGPAPAPGERRTLFRLRGELYLSPSENYTPYDISPDGNRFLMARRAQTGAAAPMPLIVTEHWFEELKQRMNRR